MSTRATVALAAELHDVGKIAIPDRILRKPGPLDDLEAALSEIVAGRGTHFDPAVVDMFLEHEKGLRAIMEELTAA